MSKELIEKLREDGKFLGGNFGKLMQEAADALEAKAAPVGEREAFDKWYRNAKGLSDTTNTTFIDGAFFPYKAFQAGAAHQRQQATDWQPSGADYDRSIHSNPDAKAWADFFVATFPGLSDKHELMIGWFANAMMAMHDYLKAQQAREVVMPNVVEFAVSRWEAEVKHRPLVNVHRRALDGTWRQIIRFAGGDPDELCGPDHDTLIARLNKGGSHEQ